MFQNFKGLFLSTVLLASVSPVLAAAEGLDPAPDAKLLVKAVDSNAFDVANFGQQVRLMDDGSVIKDVGPRSEPEAGTVSTPLLFRLTPTALARMKAFISLVKVDEKPEISVPEGAQCQNTMTTAVYLELADRELMTSGSSCHQNTQVRSASLLNKVVSDWLLF